MLKTRKVRVSTTEKMQKMMEITERELILLRNLERENQKIERKRSGLWKNEGRFEEL